VSLDFIITGLPRSGTTWASVWLTTPECVVSHDPLYRTHYSDWDKTYDAVSCTGIWRFPDFLAAQKCPIIVIHRPSHEVNTSLARLGVPGFITAADEAALDNIEGHHIDHTDLWDGAKAHRIWKLVHPDLPYDIRRHHELSRVHIEPKHDKLKPQIEPMKRLTAELKGLTAA